MSPESWQRLLARRRKRYAEEELYRKKAADLHHRCHANAAEKRRQRKRAYTQEQRRRCLLAYGGPVCGCCDESIVEFLTIDHIAGGGNAHKRDRIQRGEVRLLYAWLIKNGFPPGFQVLCFNCNSAKYINGICPHQQRKAETA